MKKRKPSQKRSGHTEKSVEAIRHGDASRKNIPTRETSDFVGHSPIELKRYLRACPNPHLTWAGRDEVDGGDEMDVPVVPIFIHDKIVPSAIIENVSAEAQRLAGTSLGTGGG